MKKIIDFLINFFKNILIRFKKNIRISLLSYIDSKSVLEDNIYIARFCNLTKVEIDEYTYIGYGTTISHAKIGKFCSIAPEVKIGPGNHPSEYVSTSPLFYKEINPIGVSFINGKTFKENEKIFIGNDVWIGTKAIIMGGVKINNGAIIAAGAVVTKDVPAYSIVAGVPAKVIKYRFSNEIIQRLENIKWWKWNIDKIKANAKEFRNIKRFLK